MEAESNTETLAYFLTCAMPAPKNGERGNPSGMNSLQSGKQGDKGILDLSWADHRLGYIPNIPGEVRSGGKWP